MKILHIIPSLKKGGAERLVLDICRKLSENLTHVVKLVTFESSNDYLDLTESIDWTVVPAKAELSFLKKDKLYISELQEFINSFKPNIIHTHLFEAEIICSFIKYTKTKWISHCHGNMPQFENFNFNTIFRKSKITNYYEKIVYKNGLNKNGGKHFIAISRHSELFLKRTMPNYNITLLHNAIDYERFLQTKTINPNYDTLKLISIGSLNTRKNHSFLINVAKTLLNCNINFELHILGNGSLKKSLEQNIQDFGLQKHVILHGNITNVENFLWDSHIYLHSALYEPLGLVIIEAMAAGLPVVTTDGYGNRDLIIDGKNGFMIKNNDLQTFIKKILYIWNNKEVYSNMSSFSQKFAKQYDISLYADKLLDLYKK